MQWDLGLQGLAVLAGMALIFGVLAHLVAGRSTRWMWAVASGTYFVAGLLISEVWFGSATAAELQPNIDGLSFDEVLLLAWIPGVVVVLIARFLMRTRVAHAAT
jgi:hypothetical protein